MRLVLAALVASLAGLAQAGRILMVPLDNRPAAGQFAQMIARIGDARVQMPPYKLLGGFQQPGNPEAILSWLESSDLSDVSALIVSADMIAYGGLVASRVPNTTEGKALQRLQRLERLAKRARPGIRVYVFSSVMRLAPTALRSNRAWRAHLASYVVFREQHHRTGDKARSAKIAALKALIPPKELERYDSVRRRDHAVQQQLIRMAGRSFDYLIVGQDDAQPYGPHMPETKVLKALVASLEIGGKVYFCEGVDQNSNVLVSRAMLKAAGWNPRVRIVYSDPYGRKKIGAYESKTIQETVLDQLLASGARVAEHGFPADYTLYVNTPERRDLPFEGFYDEIRNALDQAEPVVLADINLARDGTCDRVLFERLQRENRFMRLLAFAGWNTPGNTLGTAIPAANIALLAKRTGVAAIERETAQKTFLLHRLVDDVLFHRFTRPKAYFLMDQLRGGAREEAYGEPYRALDAFVKRDVRTILDSAFKDQLFGHKIASPEGEHEIAQVENVRIFLPWPRAYEMRLEFALGTRLRRADSDATTTAAKQN